MVADIEDWRRWTHQKLRASRLNAKEVSTPMKGDNFTQWQMEQSKFLEEIDVWDHPTLIRGQSRTRRRVRKSSRRIRRTLFFTPSSRWLNTGWRGSYKWFLVYYRRFHLSPSRGTQSQTVRAERRNQFLFRWSTSTVTAHTSLDVLLEKNIDDYCNVAGERELSDAWTGFTSFFNERPPDGYTRSGEETDEETKQTQDPTMYGQIWWKHMSNASKRKAKQKWPSRNQSSIMPDNYEVSSSLNQMMKTNHEKCS